MILQLVLLPLLPLLLPFVLRQQKFKLSIQQQPSLSQASAPVFLRHRRLSSFRCCSSIRVSCVLVERHFCSGAGFRTKRQLTSVSGSCLASVRFLLHLFSHSSRFTKIFSDIEQPPKVNSTHSFK